MRRATVIVLGDLGHSPRILNQAYSLSNLENFEVNLVGYKGSKIAQKIQDKKNIKISYIKPAPSLQSGLWKYWYVLYAPIKAIYLFFSLLYSLLSLPKSEFILVQNPPAIPTLFLIKLISFINGSKIIIDWHNFGYSILALKFGPKSFVVKLAHLYELYFGRSAYAHITVTEAMARELIGLWKVSGKVIVLHDRAPEEFKRLNIQEINDTMMELENSQPEFCKLKNNFLSTDCIELDVSTLITNFENKATPRYREDRPYLLVSSTSWTPDEDFSILLKALKEYDKEACACTSTSTFSKLAVIITGKGPDKEKYSKIIEELNPKLQYVKIITSWLPIHLYPKLLGSADLGISLHTSSSGLDLPMKVVDMFGTGLPVCAMDFECLDELVINNDNGLIFSSSEELFIHLKTLFANGFERTNAALSHLKKGAIKFSKIKWEDHWNMNLKHIFD